MVAELGDDLDLRTTMFARIDLITQLATLLLQALVAGRLMQRVGVPLTLALLPLTTALGFVGLALVGSLAALIGFEAAFRAVQRALMRPAREALFTVLPREDKYKAKAFIDTFVYRGGDVVGAQLEGLSAGWAWGWRRSPAWPCRWRCCGPGWRCGWGAPNSAWPPPPRRRAAQDVQRHDMRAPGAMTVSEQTRWRAFAMISRRDYLKLCLATGVTLSLKSAPSWAAGRAGAPNADLTLELITRAIPASGERLPQSGWGAPATFAEVGA